MFLQEIRFTDFIVGLFSTIFIICGAVIMYYQYCKMKQKTFLYIIIAWSFTSLWSLFTLISFFLSESAVYVSGSIFLVPQGFLLILFFDSISRETIDPLKILIMATTSTVFLISVLTPTAVMYSGSLDELLLLQINDLTSVAFFIFITYQGIIFTYYCIRLYFNAPSNMKIPAVLILMGALFFGIFAIIISVTGTDRFIPGSYFPFIGFGSLLMAIGFHKQYKLAFILPFRALQLTIISTKTGTPIFNHIWNPMEELIDNALFSGMMHAIGQFIEESMKKGNIKEILLDQATLLLQRDAQYPIICVLVTTKSTRVLRNALSSFSKRFLKEFSSYFSEPSIIDNFKPATRLITEFFPFIPEYNK